MPKIVVSYRRSDSSASAGRIYDHLLGQFGEGSVFMDVDAIPFGTDFRRHINDELVLSDILLAVIGPNWLGRGEAEARRIDDAADPVRVEIETALRNGIAIVPVLIDGATMPGANQLPASLKDLAFLNAAPVDMGRDFRAHMERLTRSLRAIIHDRPTQLTSMHQAAAHAAGPRPRLAIAAAVALGVTAMGATAAWQVWGQGAPAKATPARPDGSVSSRIELPSTSRSRSHGTFAWYELWTTDMAKAQAFYRSVIGWDARTTGAGEAAYTTFLAGQVPVAGLATLPAATVAQGARPAWVGYVSVTDVDASAAQVKRLGGAIYRAPADVPGIGRYALAADPQGGLIVLFKGLTEPLPAQAASPRTGFPGPRRLQAADRDEAFAFYANVFGWTRVDARDMSNPDDQLVAAGGETIGSIAPKPAGLPTSLWTYSFAVDGLNAAIDRATGHGATITEPPQPAPGGGWIARGLDPQGAAFALVSPAR